MKIRKLSKSDIDHCSRILMNSYSKKPYFEKFDINYAKQYIEQKYNCCQKTCFVAVIKNEIVGFVFWQISAWGKGKQAVLEEIVVNPNHQGKGVGSELFRYSEDKIRKAKVQSTMLWAKNDENLLKFHQKNGFIIADDYVVMFKDY